MLGADPRAAAYGAAKRGQAWLRLHALPASSKRASLPMSEQGRYRSPRAVLQAMRRERRRGHAPDRRGTRTRASNRVDALVLLDEVELSHARELKQMEFDRANAATRVQIGAVMKNVSAYAGGRAETQAQPTQAAFGQSLEQIERVGRDLRSVCAALKDFQAEALYDASGFAQRGLQGRRRPRGLRRRRDRQRGVHGRVRGVAEVLGEHGRGTSGRAVLVARSTGTVSCMRRGEAGFTLLELVVTVAIAVILARRRRLLDAVDASGRVARRARRFRCESRQLRKRSPQRAVTAQR